jgi:REP element-mobilizing transposase RayT
MSTKYKAGDSAIPHFISFAVVDWIDALTRQSYNEIILDSLRYCMENKGLCLHAWVIMSNHVHLIISAKNEVLLSDILRDLKKYTSKQIIQAIANNSTESRKEWMLYMFKRAGRRNVNNTTFQFWQQDNHPIELRTASMLRQRLQYLHENPVKAGIVYEPADYVYSSAIDYFTNHKGKIDIEHLGC